MKRETRNSIRALCLAPITARRLLSAPLHAQTAPAVAAASSMLQGHVQKGMAGSEVMHYAMMTATGRMQKMPMSGDTDKGFAMMKIHHQQAVDMAQTELAHGKSAAMKAMAKQIIAAQKKEIAQFDRWLAKPECLL